MGKPFSLNTVFQEIFKTLIFSRIWVALCVLGYTQVTFILFYNDVTLYTYAIMLMFAGYLLYVLPFIYYSVKGIKKTYNDRQKWIQNHLLRFYITGAIVTIVLAIIAYTHLYIFFTMVLFGSGVGLVTILYELPLIPYKGRFVALREWGFLKPIILTFVWWYLGAYGIAKGWANDIWGAADNTITFEGWVLLAIQFIFMLILCVLFDIRDYHIDAVRKISTWPVKWGIKKTHYVLICMSALSILAVWVINIAFYIQVANTLTFLILILFSSQKIKTNYWWFHDLAVDGMMLIQWGILYLLFLLF